MKGYSKQVDVVNLKVFIGILLFSSYVQLLRRRMFWSALDDYHYAVIGNFMARNRFEDILSFWLVTDNNALDMQEKFSLLNGPNRKSLDIFLS